MALATVTLTQSQAALQGLIDQLADNAPPPEPSPWPPALLEWLAALVVLALIVAVAVHCWRTRHRRRYLRALNALKRRPSTTRTLADLHRLLRNAAARRDPALRAASDPVFAERAAAELARSEAPAWLNAHYRPETSATVNWRDARRLIKRWCA